MSEGHDKGAKLRVAVVGGGMGGLAAANFLLRRGFDVTVYEQAGALGEVGAGVFIFPNSLRQLERIGFREPLAAVGAKVGPGSQYYRMDGSVVGPIQMTDSSGWPGMYGMHRADMLSVLAAALPAGRVRTGHRCVGFEQDERGARLFFAHGVQAEADVVVAADGIQSVLQKYVVPPQPPEYSGSRAYRGLVARDKLATWNDRTHQVWMGDGKHFMVFPVRGGQLLNYVGFVPTGDELAESWSAIGDRDELAASFAGWHAPIVDLLSKVESCFWWGLYDRAPLVSWTQGRLVLLGDAAHPMLPHLGQGANQAIEDGCALAIFLEGRASAEVPAVLKDYEAFRRPRTDLIQAEARRNGLRYDSRSGSLEQRDREIATSGQFRKSLYDYDIEKDALERLGRTVAVA